MTQDNRIPLKDYPLARLFARGATPEEKAEAAEIREALGSFLEQRRLARVRRERFV